MHPPPTDAVPSRAGPCRSCTARCASSSGPIGSWTQAPSLLPPSPAARLHALAPRPSKSQPAHPAMLGVPASPQRFFVRESSLEATPCPSRRVSHLSHVTKYRNGSQNEARGRPRAGAAQLLRGRAPPGRPRGRPTPRPLPATGRRAGWPLRRTRGVQPALVRASMPLEPLMSLEHWSP